MSRGPSIPPEAKGLIAALAAARRGDSYPLLLWHGTPRACLRTTLETWCGDPELADATLACIVSRAFRVGVAGIVVRDEPSWLSVEALHHVADLARNRRRALALAMRYASTITEASSEPSERAAATARGRAHARVVAAIVLLPSPYAQAMTLRHVHGLPEQQVARWVMEWNPIGPHGARYILREGRKMLDVALMGRHPMRRWPRRYPGNPRWSTTPPYPRRRL